MGKLTLLRLLTLTLGLWERPNLSGDWSPMKNNGGLKEIVSKDSEAINPGGHLKIISEGATTQ